MGIRTESGQDSFIPQGISAGGPSAKQSPFTTRTQCMIRRLLVLFALLLVMAPALHAQVGA
ncbi:MAG: hypothetical protein ABJE10_21465, partial [bacterium]